MDIHKYCQCNFWIIIMAFLFSWGWLNLLLNQDCLTLHWHYAICLHFQLLDWIELFQSWFFSFYQGNYLHFLRANQWFQWHLKNDLILCCHSLMRIVQLASANSIFLHLFISTLLLATHYSCSISTHRE